MKKLLILAASILAATQVQAANIEHKDFTVGYAKTKFKAGNGKQYNSSTAKGFSATFASIVPDEIGYVGTTSMVFGTGSLGLTLSAGPAYKLNEYVAIYAVGGVSYLSGEYTPRNKPTKSDSDVGFNYGAGVRVSPTSDFVINVGIERKNHDLHGFDVNGSSLILGVGLKL